MGKLTDLRTLFRVVAVVELAYGFVGLLPPSWIEPVTGWTLSPDGHWVAKVLAISLIAQAWIAWVLRDRPHVGVAAGLAGYQIGAATVDWVMWVSLPGTFATGRAQIGVATAIVLHYLLGVLLLRGIARVGKPT